MQKNIVAIVRSLWKNETGAIISAELVLVMTIAVLAMVVGLKSVSGAVSAELEDVAEAFGAINQSYCFSGLQSCSAIVSGSSFNDSPDVCDCAPLNTNVGHISVHDKCE